MHISEMAAKNQYLCPENLAIFGHISLATNHALIETKLSEFDFPHCEQQE